MGPSLGRGALCRSPLEQCPALASALPAEAPAHVLVGSSGFAGQPAAATVYIGDAQLAAEPNLPGRAASPAHFFAVYRYMAENSLSRDQFSRIAYCPAASSPTCIYLLFSHFIGCAPVTAGRLTSVDTSHFWWHKPYNKFFGLVRLCTLSTPLCTPCVLKLMISIGGANAQSA